VADLEIDLPRPRTVEMRASEAFGRLSLDIFRTLTGRFDGSITQPGS
jgi:NitT/TauT family transport system ATP-binding protein